MHKHDNIVLKAVKITLNNNLHFSNYTLLWAREKSTPLSSKCDNQVRSWWCGFWQFAQTATLHVSSKAVVSERNSAALVKRSHVESALFGQRHAAVRKGTQLGQQALALSTVTGAQVWADGSGPRSLFSPFFHCKANTRPNVARFTSRTGTISVRSSGASWSQRIWRWMSLIQNEMPESFRPTFG